MSIGSVSSEYSVVSSAIEAAYGRNSTNQNNNPKNVLENLVHLSDYDVVFDPIKFPDDDTDFPWEIKTSNPDKYQRILEQTYEHVVTRSPKIKAQLKFNLGRIFYMRWITIKLPLN